MKAIVSIAYDGPALSEKSMDVKDLAPALLSMGELLEEANATLNGDESRLAVTVKAGFEVGSFEIVLELVQRISETVKFFLVNKAPFTPSDIAAIVGLLSGGGVSVIGLIKWLRGRPIKRATVIKNGNIKIETDNDFDSIEVSEQTVRLFRNPKVRKGIYDTLAPLENDGVEQFSVKERKKEIQTIKKNRTLVFYPPGSPR